VSYSIVHVGYSSNTRDGFYSGNTHDGFSGNEGGGGGRVGYFSNNGGGGRVGYSGNTHDGISSHEGVGGGHVGYSSKTRDGFTNGTRDGFSSDGFTNNTRDGFSRQEGCDGNIRDGFSSLEGGGVSNHFSGTTGHVLIVDKPDDGKAVDSNDMNDKENAVGVKRVRVVEKDLEDAPDSYSFSALYPPLPLDHRPDVDWLQSWPQPSDLKNELNQLAASQKFTVSSAGAAIRCNRARGNKSQEAAQAKRIASTEPSKRRKSSSIKCNCSWRVVWTRVSDIGENRRPRNLDPKHVVIGSAHYEHDNGCAPDDASAVVTSLASGRFTKNIFQLERCRTLVDLVRYGGCPTRTIRKFLEESGAFPSGVPITSTAVFNLRRKITTLLNQAQIDGASPRTDVHSKLAHYLNEGVKQPEPDLDHAAFIDTSRYSADLLKAILAQGQNDATRILRCLSDLATQHPSFTYRVAYNTRNEPTGFVWMTGAMRRMFEINGDILFLDCMKRTMNTVNWPYIAPVILDGDRKIFEVAEALVCTERQHAYNFVLQSIFQMAPKRHKSTIRVIFGDGIMSDTLLSPAMLDIADTCKICFDVYHLTEVDWPRFFGPPNFSRVKDHFMKLIYSKSEEEYNDHFTALHNLMGGNRGYLNYLNNEIHPNREKFVRYWVQQIEGSYTSIALHFVLLLCHSIQRSHFPLRKFGMQGRFICRVESCLGVQATRSYVFT
jgi:hypothetical protein